MYQNSNQSPSKSRIKFSVKSSEGENRYNKESTITNSNSDSDASSLGDDIITVSGATEQQVTRKFKQKFVILHYSPFKAVWDWVVLLLVVYTAIFTPFTVAFLLNEDEKRAKLNQHASTRLFKKQNMGADPFVIIDLIVDLMFLVDIFITFRTTYISNDGEAIYDPMLIAKNYLKSWFTLDCVAAMPYDLILFGSGNIDTIKITGLLKIMRLLRLIRILPQLQKVSEYGIAMLLLLVSVFGLVGHWLACVFYAIAYLERPTLPDPKYSWLDHLAEKYNMPYRENNSDSGPDLKSKYITALFFTLTSLTSVGFGNVSPTTNWEKIFSIMSMLLGSLISAAIFGNVTTIMIKMYQGTEELKEMQESVKDFIKFHYIPKILSKRMHESFEHTWSYTNGIDMNTVLKSFPESLQADICLHLNRQLLNRCPAFEDAGEGCLRMLALQFKSTHTPPGDTLIHKGDNLNAFYFIARGTLEIVKNNEVMAILDKNDIFGENLGKYQEKDVMGRSSCDVRALSYCDLHKIERSDLLDVLDIYPDFAESFEKKFQVTFDLRECEMTEHTAKSKIKRNSKFNNFIEDKSDVDQTEMNFLKSVSTQRMNSFNESSFNDNSLNVSHESNLHDLNKNLSKYSINDPSIDSTANVIPINTNRNRLKFQNLIKKKTRLLKNVALLAPSASITEGVVNNGKVLNPNDLENEIDQLINRVTRTEENLNHQMNMLTNFIINFVTNDNKQLIATNHETIHI